MTKIFILISLLFSMAFAAFGQGWSTLGVGASGLKANGAIYCLASDHSGNIYAAGNFRNAAGYRYVAKWDGTAWSELQGLNNLLPEVIYSLTTDPSGNVYAGGVNPNEGFLAKWDGFTWTNLNNSFHSPYNDFSKTASDEMGNIYAAVMDTNNVSIWAMHIVKWDGNSWSSLGTFPPKHAIYSVVAAGNGIVYASVMDSTYHHYVTKWDGVNWVPIGYSSTVTSYIGIQSLLIDNSENIYINSSTFIAKWVNNDWAKLDTGSTPLSGGTTSSFCSDPLGNIFIMARTIHQNHYTVYKWDGYHWDALGFEYGVDTSFIGSLETVISDQNGNIYTAGYAGDSFGFFVAKYTPPHTSAIDPLDKLDQSLKLYPNPSTGDIFLQLPYDHPTLKIFIFNILGQIVQTYTVHDNGLKSPFKINVGELANSQYMIQIVGNNVRLSRRFTKG